MRGFVAKSHLPPRVRGDITKVGKAMRCVVMFCQQNSPLLVLSAHPDVVAISKTEKRSSFLVRWGTTYILLRLLVYLVVF